MLSASAGVYMRLIAGTFSGRYAVGRQSCRRTAAQRLPRRAGNVITIRYTWTGTDARRSRIVYVQQHLKSLTHATKVIETRLVAYKTVICNSEEFGHGTIHCRTWRLTSSLNTQWISVTLRSCRVPLDAAQSYPVRSRLVGRSWVGYMSDGACVAIM